MRALRSTLLLPTAALWATLTSGPSLADADAPETSPSPLTVGGSLRGAWWAYSRELDKVPNIAVGSVWLDGRLDLGAAGDVRANGWVGAQSRDQPPTYPNGRLRELYWSKGVGDLDVRVGSEIILWGRADAINPTDNLTPRDYTLLTPEDNDQRFGNIDVNAVYHWGDYSAQLVYLPKFYSDVIPLLPKPGVTYTYVTPEAHDNWAFKFDHTGGGLDWSLSYYNGLDVLPDLGFAGISASGLKLSLTNHKMQVVGADFSATTGPYVLRGEVAWMYPDRVTVNPFEQKKPQIFAVLGGERKFGDDLNINLQYFAQRVFDFVSPDTIANPIAQAIAWEQAEISNQTSAFQQGMTFRVAYTWDNNSWQAEASGIYSFTNKGQLWRGKLSHAIDDHWRVSAGIDIFGGTEHSTLSLLKNNSTGYVELRYSF
jgi:hypothetical protein